MYNLNTKRAMVEEGGTIEWVSGSFGSHVGCLYPMSILKGEGARMEFTGITFAGAGQDLDTGAKVVHAGTNTSSLHEHQAPSARDGGISTFRSVVVVLTRAPRAAKSAVSCQSLMLDDRVPLRHHPRDGHPLRRDATWATRPRSAASATTPSST